MPQSDKHPRGGALLRAAHGQVASVVIVVAWDCESEGSVYPIRMTHRVTMSTEEARWLLEELQRTLK